MPTNLFANFRAERWLILFLAVHLIFWTVVPALVRLNLPLDAIEGTTWGHQLELGYDKNPYLNGWLTALAVYMGHSSEWVIYFFSQLSVVICFWAIWKIAKNILPKAHALIAVMLLETMQYYNFHAIDFNDNTLELGLWGLTIYCFYNVLQRPTVFLWMLVGLFAGLGLMAKYYTITLLAAMFLFLLFPANRKHFTSLPLYMGLLTFLFITLPHFIWLFFHDFVTLTYVLARGKSLPHWTNHFFYPLQFTWQQIEVFLPALFLTLCLFIGKKASSSQTKMVRPFDKAFLMYVGLGPFLLTLLISLCMGTKLRAGWGMPLLSLWGILLLAYVQPKLSLIKLRLFISSILLFMGVSLTVYSFSIVYSPDPSSANFPGRKIAETITQTWHENYHTPLAYVAGSRWVGGNISFYSKDKPAVFINWKTKQAPWIDLNDMKQKGAVFVWSITDKERLPEAIRAQFTELKSPQVLTFTWLRNEKELPPIQIGIAILPPGSK